MHVYEIRVLNLNHRPTAFIELQDANDENAIRVALKLAYGRAVEVWRDLDCLYRAPAQAQRSKEAA